MSTHVPVSSKIAGFYVLPLQLAIVHSFPISAIHYLYLRPDDPKVADIRTSRTLFLVNVPIDTTELHVKHLFSYQLDLPAGRIEEVKIESLKAQYTSRGPHIPIVASQEKNKKRKRGSDESHDAASELEAAWPETWDREIHQSGSSATVVFVDRASMDAAIKAARRFKHMDKLITWGDGIEGKVPPLGRQRYEEHHRRCYPQESELLEKINRYMTIYAARETARAQALAKQRSEPDADGFVTVTRGGRNSVARANVVAEQLERQKEKRRGLDDFYRFQFREKRKEKANELIRKFEQDKAKVRKMKKKRFKPE